MHQGIQFFCGVTRIPAEVLSRIECAVRLTYLALYFRFVERGVGISFSIWASESVLKLIAFAEVKDMSSPIGVTHLFRFNAPNKALA